ncbi:hypothetical protein Mgra_00003304 [Meloidogyne graminicola]|uniref:ShKT domain-containing protein n=1 Tax=Meloidogyne graminicola TaxID=189291 RepID=A0A8S9ZUX4_9BILA|nr:hypothetical protein Mgra_00003304 [Meloidogyne graminicola]
MLPLQLLRRHYLISLLIFCFIWSVCYTQLAHLVGHSSKSTLEDQKLLDHHSRHHPIMGPCVDRGQFCDKLKRFCNDFKYQTLINKECRATCGRC